MNFFPNKNLQKKRKDLNPERNKSKERKAKMNRIMMTSTMKKVFKMLKTPLNRPILTINTN
jgi:hypothetical protein